MSTCRQRHCNSRLRPHVPLLGCGHSQLAGESCVVIVCATSDHCLGTPFENLKRVQQLQLGVHPSPYARFTVVGSSSLCCSFFLRCSTPDARIQQLIKTSRVAQLPYKEFPLLTWLTSARLRARNENIMKSFTFLYGSLSLYRDMNGQCQRDTKELVE